MWILESLISKSLFFTHLETTATTNKHPRIMPRHHNGSLDPLWSPSLSMVSNPFSQIIDDN